MFNFLKSFLSGDKSPEEAILSAENTGFLTDNAARKHDFINLDAYAMEDGEDTEQSGGCGSGSGSGCGGCGCR